MQVDWAYYANWLVPELEKELKERGLFCSYKRGETLKLVKRLDADDAGTHGTKRLDFEVAMIGLAGVPRSMVQECDNAENEVVVSHLQIQPYNTRSRKIPIAPRSQAIQ